MAQYVWQKCWQSSLLLYCGDLRVQTAKESNICSEHNQERRTASPQRGASSSHQHKHKQKKATLALPLQLC
jgi:hypothetical protein